MTRHNPSLRRPMRAQDHLWLHLDTPVNRLVVTSVLWTATPVDPGALRSVLADRVLARYPVFLQRPVGRRVWEADPDFDLGRHFTVSALPPPGDTATLREHVARRLGSRLDLDHPLWTIELLQGYGPGSAVVSRFHHAMADGIRLTQVMFGMLDPLRPDPTPPAPVGGTAVRHGPTAHAAARLATTGVQLLTRLGEHVEVPPVRAALALGTLGGAAALAVTGAFVEGVAGRLPGGPRRLAGHVAEQAVTAWHTAVGASHLVRPAYRGPWHGEPGLAKAAAWSEPVPLDLVHGIAHRTGTTVNDVCAALLTGALDRYLAGRDHDLLHDMPWMVPVSLERFDAALPPLLGNHFALVLAALPLARAGFPERLLEVHRRMARIRDSYEPLVNVGVQDLVGRGSRGAAVALTRYLTARSAGVLTNVPGPREEMALAGARVLGAVGWAPCSGRQPITVCIFSYAGRIRFGFATDETLIPDPGRLVRALDDEVRYAEAVMGATTAS
ncbi:diacylglycerol O-acyltransferase [Amycolatopsis sacchari]|uniref:diacylglycerol O-acyltransferase n=1 Tax=Amycolatopsis sacchari TaxID=115433 RepID=A0A1I3KUE2_9PSEU|nr:WS/DGAT domain-containing protein [Amycolatopsis sacchari]SFI76102.1 diacylglycerol O-acyltransferase [Amycolatopsis sacchari]